MCFGAGIEFEDNWKQSLNLKLTFTHLLFFLGGVVSLQKCESLRTEAEMTQRQSRITKDHPSTDETRG